MPRDLLPDDGLLVVHDRAGARLPFSRGIMASSLLPTGVATAEAHRLASLIHESLQRDGITAIEADELVARASRVLDEHAGEQVVARWRAWRNAKRAGTPVVVAISGPPGVGKSSIATRLALRLGITRIVTTDTIREVLRTVVPASVLPELHVSSPRLITPASPDPYAGFDRQAHAVGGATRAVADRLAVEQRSCVVEGVHLLPGRLGIDLAAHPARPIVVERMLVEPDPQIHYHRLLRRSEQEPLRGGRQGLDGFDRVRAIQEHLAAMAADRGIPVVEPGGFGELTQTIVDEIVRRTEERDLPGAA